MPTEYAFAAHDRAWYLICGDENNIVPNSRHDDTCFGAQGFISDKPYPATSPHSSRPAGGDNGHKLNKHLWDYIYELNRRFGSLIGWEKARKIWSGYINSARNVGKEWSPPEWEPGYTIPLDTTTFPKVEGITSIHNYVKVLERKNGAARIETYKYNQTMPSLDIENPRTHPWKFCKFTSVAKDTGAVGLAPEGELFYFPLLAPGDAWMRDEQLIYNVELPNQEKPMTADFDFTDVSYHNGAEYKNNLLDWTAIKDSGVKGAISKCWDAWFLPPGGYGKLQHFDPAFLYNWNGSVEFDLRGAYLYGRFETESWRPNSLAEQVNKAIDYIPAPRKAEDIFMLDIEPPAKDMGHISLPSREAMLVDALQEAESKWPKKYIWLYSARWWWNEQMPKTLNPYFLEFPMVVAYYGTRPLVELLPNGWPIENVIAHQWSESENIQGYPVANLEFDANAFLWDWDTYFDTINPTPPPPVPSPTDVTAVLDEMQVVIDRNR